MQHDIAGDFCNHDEPDWQPLYDIVGVQLADWFMWMCEVELVDGTRVHAYKHITTRQYFYLGDDGRAFEYALNCRYRAIDRRTAIDIVFDSWEELASGPNDSECIALKDARQAAGPRAGASRRTGSRQPRRDSGAAV
jgi:hypothetical protein